MTTAVVAAIVVVVLVVIAIAAVLVMRTRPAGGGLKHRFGPEYDRTLAHHDGDVKATRKELSDRVRRYGSLDRRALSEPERDRYKTQWSAVQAHFVQDPGQSVSEGDRLIARLAQDRGFPAAGSPEHFDALSVHHAHQVQGYRQAHALAEHAGAGGRQGTEDLRQALVASRELFDELLAGDVSSTSARRDDSATAPDREPGSERSEAAQTDATSADADTDSDTDSRTDAATDTDTEAPAESDEAAPRTLGNRFAALTGSGRKANHNGSEHL
jgi:hypothetical protein